MTYLLVFISLSYLGWIWAQKTQGFNTSATVQVPNSSEGFSYSGPEQLIYIPPDYVQAWAPVQDDKPLTIYVDLHLWAIRDISATNMDMEVELWVYVYWTDYRISINMNTVRAKGGLIPVGSDANKLWRPTLQFRNCRGCPPLNLDPHTYVPHIDSKTNEFCVAIRTQATFSCNIDVSAYPMDRQRCNVQLENYYEDVSKVKLVNADRNPREFWTDLKLAEFHLDNVTANECFQSYRPAEGNFSCIELELRLTRFMGYHLTTTYAPTVCIVILSWISFWLPTDLAPARIMLGVTTLLTLTTRLDQAQQNLPAVSYVKAIDVWMFACIFLVFSSLFEFAISFYWMRRYKQKVSPTQNIDLDYMGNTPSRKSYSHSRTVQDTTTKQLQDINIIDRVSQVAFPVSFLLFNICYWATYLSYYKSK